LKIAIEDRKRFILKLAKALMQFGAPSHRIESMLTSVSRTLLIRAEFVHLPSVILTSFGNAETRTSKTYFVKSSGGLDLGKIHTTHTIYRQVVHDVIGADEGWRKLDGLLRKGPMYEIFWRCVWAFGCSAAIGPLAFGASFLDMWVGGVASSVLVLVQLRWASRNAVLAAVFE
jgi:uncharacterized membrane protein YjjP (DUF1212 family)